MKTSRRGALKIAGAAALVGAGALAWRAVDQGVFSVATGPAYDPWRTWDARPPEGPLHLVHAAILAANPHNSQPWMFRVTDDTIDVYADTRRSIGAIDPHLREMYMGIGCALENLLIAAAHIGYATTVKYLPDPANPAHAATLRLERAAPAAQPLYAAIPRRHTNRGPYDPARAIAPEMLAQLSALADGPEVRVLWYAKLPERSRIGELIVAATQAIVADREQSADSAKWFRSNWQQLQSLRDGITLDAQCLPPFMNAAAKILPPLDAQSADKAWLQATRERHVATAAAFGLIAVPDARDNTWRLRGGRLWQRMHLWATNHGLAAHPLNQMSERADRERQLGIEPRFGNALTELVGDASLQALMPFRIGYPTIQALPSPRRDLKTVLV
jgi:hypothetical protein